MEAENKTQDQIQDGGNSNGPEQQQPPVTVIIPENGFQYQDKIYKVTLHAVFIPGLGKRTAAEITVDEEAQKYLVEEKTAAIEEVV